MPKRDPTYQPITEDDSFFVGEDSEIDWTIFTLEGTIQDLTGFALQWKLGLTKEGAAVLTKSGSIISAPAGTCQVICVAADTASLAPGNYYYALRRTSPGSNAVLAHGSVALQGSPT